MHGPLWSPAHHEGPPPRQSGVRGLDPRLRPPRRSHAHLRLRADARGCDGSVRQELAAGVAPMTNHDDVPDPTSCAGMGSHILHPVGRSGGHIRACPYSLMASRITTGRAKRLPAIPMLASAMQGARLRTNAQIESPLFGGKPEKHTLVLSFRVFNPRVIRTHSLDLPIGLGHRPRHGSVV